MKIRPKIQIAFLAVGLIPLLLFGWFSLNRATAVLRARFLDQLDSFADVQKNRVEMLLERDLERLKLVSSRTQLRINLKNHILDPQERYETGLLRILQDAKGSIPSFRKLSVVRLDGRVLVSTDPAWRGLDLSAEAYYRRGLAINHADTFAAAENGALVVLLAGPLILERETLGVLVAEASGQGFVDIARSYHGLGQTGETILVRQDDDQQLRYVTSLRFNPAAALQAVSPDTAGWGLLQTAFQAGAQSLTQATDYRGCSVLAVTRQIADNVASAPPQPPRMALVVKIDRAEVFALAGELQKVSFLILGATLLAVLVVSFFLSNSITRPIRSLAVTANSISQGDAGQRARPHGDDEIALLAGNFNRMAESLTEANRTLERKVVERTRELEVTQERFALAVQGSTDGIWDWNVVTNEVFYSARFKELLGYPPDGFENVFSSWENRLHPADKDPTLAAMRSHLAQRTPLDVECRLRCRDGSYRWFRTRGTAIWNAAGQASRMAGSISDVTDRKLVEEELKRSNQELEQFAYIASHDLKEPLRMVSSYLQLLNQRHQAELDGEAREFTRIALEGASRMQRLIEDLLLYSRIRSRELDLTRVNTQAVLDIALANLQVAIQDRGAIINHGTLPEVFGDETQLVQLFQNLLGNAIKFCPKDRTPEVQILAVPKEDHWLFQFADNGIGIESASRERIFQIFQRACSRDQYEGTGIGLAVCQKIVERHQGQIWVESQPGQGSTFFFTLPTRAVNDPTRPG